MAGDRKQCLGAGMDDYLTKPLNPAQLVAKLLQWAAPGQEIQTEVETPVTSQTVAEAETFNYAKVLERCLNKPLVVKQFLTKFIDRLPEDLSTLRSAVASGNPDAIAKLGHKLKGTAANLAVEALLELAERLEKAARIGEMDQCRQLLTEIEVTVDSFRADVASFFSQ